MRFKVTYFVINVQERTISITAPSTTRAIKELHELLRTGDLGLQETEIYHGIKDVTEEL